MKEARELYSRLSKSQYSKNKNCQDIGQRLGISGKYFLQIINGTREPSQPLKKRILVLLAKKSNRPAYKPRLVVSYDDQGLYETHKALDNTERKEAFSLYLQQKKAPD